MYKLLIRPILFSFDPENIHYRVFSILKLIHKLPLGGLLMRSLYNSKVNNQAVEVFGLRFKNRIGLAAGFDKDAKLFNELGSLGFGFIEVGTVTPKAQDGNPKPRLFRLPEDKALINRMGFNNGGVLDMLERLKSRKDKNLIIGGNIGKNKVTPNENAKDDYISLFNQLFDYVDYFVVNVSSPNTPNLRELQEKGPLLDLLKSLQDLNAKKDNPKPILLKIAPDLTNGQLDDIIEISKESNIAGIVATNTTISRDNLKMNQDEVAKIGAGGLSGQPVKDRSTEVISYLYKNSNEDLDIVAVGGVFSGKDALEKLEAGAKLVQVYTGFVYEGPSMISKINRYLKKHYA